MRWICLFVLAAGIAASAPQRRFVERTPNPLGGGPEVAAEGRAIYNQSCTVCHGVDGTAGDRAPALAASRRYVRRTNSELFDAIKKGIPGTLMPAMPLRDDDAWKVVAYIRSLRATAAESPVEGDVDAGAEVFWGKAECGLCHMVQGRGGLLGPNLSNLGGSMTAQRIRESLTEAKPHPPAGFRPVTITTTAGESIRGVLKNEHNFSYQVLGDDDWLHLLTSDEVRKIEYGEKSLMPTDYDKRLSESEFQNLMAYLSRLTRDGEEDE
jgi:putative heme-binding domain-containing protein